MADRRTQLHLVRCFVHYMPIILMMSVHVTQGQVNCFNRLDLVIAVDTTSSQSTSGFDAVKAEVKGIVAGFTVGQGKTRLALVSMSKSANVVVNFKDVNSLSDFNAAVDRLTFSTDIVDLSEGIKLAKGSVLNTARTDKISKVLILVKDRRSGSAVVSDKSVLTRVTSEAAAVKTLGAAINAIGVGGLWNRLELEAIFGPEYLLFKNKNSALESTKSLINWICNVDCPNKGKSSSSDGLCYKSTMQVVSTKTDLVSKSQGLTVCRKSIVREFSACSKTDRCNTIDRTFTPCNSAGKLTIKSTWSTFNYRTQACEPTKTEQTVDCSDALKCSDQVADVIFLLDKSSSMEQSFFNVKVGRGMRNYFPKVKQAAKLLIESLSIGTKQVHVGVLTFENTVTKEIGLGLVSSKKALLGAVDGISEKIRKHSDTYTHLALKKARDMLRQRGRANVARYIFVFTDGESSKPEMTFDETALLKNEGVTVYAVGIGDVGESELRTMTEPDSDKNLILLKKFNDLETWARNFTKRLCLELAAPHSKLCDNKVFTRSVSECTNGKQLVTKSEFKYSSTSKCIKLIKSRVYKTCRPTCMDPINGNQYLLGETWTSQCHDFRCDKASPFLPSSTKCIAADGSCKEVGSPPFKCRDEKGAEVENCQCASGPGGKVTLLIDKQ